MEKFELSFSFKGTREYIQGPDIFNESIQQLREQMRGNLEQVSFLIHRMTDHNLSLALYPAAQAPKPGAQNVAELKFAIVDQSWEAHLLDVGTKPDARYPYDEAAVVDLCEIDELERRIVLQHGATTYSTMETLVSMNKALHLRIFPDMKGSWVFCRWDSPRWPLGESLNGVCIQLKQALGTRLTKAEVSLDDKVLGHIYFSARNNK